MRGLPPIPDNVALLVFTYDVDGSTAHTWHWIYHADLQLMTLDVMRAWWSQIVFTAVDPVDQCMGSAGVVARVALRRFGSAPLEVTDAIPANTGAHGDCQVLLAASAVYWATPFAGRGGRAYTRWPALPDLWTDDHVHLNAIGVGELGFASAAFLHAINTADAAPFGPGTLITLHRASGGVPLDVAEPRPILAAIPVRRVARIVRRARI